ncbi:SF1B family DNA helicase RecD2 [Hungatella hathewayi]|uniref:SF1B family DNA helicase RecD2 n=1 Tax=Hungatella hathewayi TaxID=154046 RepID=UPI0011DD4661|nr:ATP-dependent RecD-like DNA helicase [Hungatella hathewayi]
MSYIGTYDGTIFYNPANKYCIISIKTEDRNIPAQARSTRQYRDHLIRFVAVGYELPRTDAVQVELDGEWKNSKHGHQLQVEQWHEIVPRTADGVEGYLSSGLIKGIGPKLAAGIVARFGVGTLDIMEKHPERLLEIKGITEARLEDIKTSYAESRMMQDLMTLLSPYKVTPKTALKIYQHFGPDSVDLLKNNPFELCQISGFGFRRVDAIVQKNGNDLHDPMRIRGALICSLDEIRGKQGHLYLDSESLVNIGLKMLNEKIPVPGLRLHKQEVEDVLQDMILKGTVVSCRDDIYLPRIFGLEDDTARQIAKRLVMASTVEQVAPVLEQIKAELGISLSAKQDKAVRVAFRHNLSIITGSPGTGKTTVLKTILEVYRRLHPDGKIMLMAPTGRASRRMAESTGFEEAQTLHSGLELFSEEEESVRKREVSPLKADLVIVDEFSMVDMWLAKQFFGRLQNECRVVMVGDVDQLPSVGAGNVFQELINCGLVPVTVLNEIFRQAKDSLIAHNAKFINEGSTKLYYGPDFVFHTCDNQNEAAEKIMERYCSEIAESGIERVQILSPFRSEGAASAEQLNEAIREMVNPFRSAEEEVKLGPKCFRVGDRIMQTKNTEKVSNGDLGFIRYIKDTEDGKKIGVDFGPNRELEYGMEELVNMDLAYATTIHKAMGSEYETVIMPLIKAHSIMLYRNLLYTAITRAKKRVVLVGQKAVLFMAIHRNEISKRNTSLGERICLYYRAFAKSTGAVIPAALEEKLKNAG